MVYLYTCDSQQIPPRFLGARMFVLLIKTKQDLRLYDSQEQRWEWHAVTPCLLGIAIIPPPSLGIQNVIS